MRKNLVFDLARDLYAHYEHVGPAVAFEYAECFIEYAEKNGYLGVPSIRADVTYDALAALSGMQEGATFACSSSGHLFTWNGDGVTCNQSSHLMPVNYEVGTFLEAFKNTKFVRLSNSVDQEMTFDAVAALGGMKKGKRFSSEDGKVFYHWNGVGVTGDYRGTKADFTAEEFVSGNGARFVQLPDLFPVEAESLQRGLEQSAKGEVYDLGDFTQYAEYTPEEALAGMKRGRKYKMKGVDVRYSLNGKFVEIRDGRGHVFSLSPDEFLSDAKGMSFVLDSPEVAPVADASEPVTYSAEEALALMKEGRHVKFSWKEHLSTWSFWFDGAIKVDGREKSEEEFFRVWGRERFVVVEDK